MEDKPQVDRDCHFSIRSQIGEYDIFCFGYDSATSELLYVVMLRSGLAHIIGFRRGALHVLFNCEYLVHYDLRVLVLYQVVDIFQ